MTQQKPKLKVGDIVVVGPDTTEYKVTKYRQEQGYADDEVDLESLVAPTRTMTRRVNENEVRNVRSGQGNAGQRRPSNPSTTNKGREKESDKSKRLACSEQAPDKGASTPPAVTADTATYVAKKGGMEAGGSVSDDVALNETSQQPEPKRIEDSPDFNTQPAPVIPQDADTPLKQWWDDHKPRSTWDDDALKALQELPKQDRMDENYAGIVIHIWMKLYEVSVGSQDDFRAHVAVMLNRILASKDEGAKESVNSFLDRHDPDSSEGQESPLYFMLLKSPTPDMKRQLARGLSRETLSGLVKFLDKPNKKRYAVDQALLDVLSEHLTVAFNKAAGSEISRYSEIADLMFRLVELLPEDLRDPYWWRLFSYLREGWARIAPHMAPGTNESGGGHRYLEWLVVGSEQCKSAVDRLPEGMRGLLVFSLLPDGRKVGTDSEKSLAEMLAYYVGRDAERLRFVANALTVGSDTYVLFIEHHAAWLRKDRGR